MAENNVEIMRSILEPMNGENVAGIDWTADAIREMVGRAYSPDIELRTLESGTGMGLKEIYRGWDGVVQYLHDWLEPFSEYRVDYLDYIEAGDFVLVPSLQRGIGGASGANVEIEVTLAYELHNGLITRLVQYESLERAREAEGL